MTNDGTMANLFILLVLPVGLRLISYASIIICA